jgi:hypothetical protein
MVVHVKGEPNTKCVRLVSMMAGRSARSNYVRGVFKVPSPIYWHPHSPNEAM